MPIQALDLAGLKILGLPGEAFSAYGAVFEKARPWFFPAGYANGDVGYFPTRRSFDDPGDYAAYSAPKFYSLFPFTLEIESLITAAGLEILAG